MGKYKDFTEDVGQILGEYKAEWYTAHDALDMIIHVYVLSFGSLIEPEED